MSATKSDISVLQHFLEHEKTSWFLHPSLLGDEILRVRAKVYVLLSLSMSFVAPFIAYPYFKDGHTTLGLMTLAFGVIAMGAVIVMKFVGSMTIATNLVGLALLGGVTSGYMVLGGVSSYTNKWLVLLPLIGIFSRQRWLTGIWLVVAVLTPIAFHFLIAQGLLSVQLVFPEEAMPVLDLGNSLVFIVGVTIFVYVLNIHHSWVVKRFRHNEEVLRERHHELAQARDEAILAGKIKDRFLANMSHELRTPLNAILGYSEMIQEELEDEDVKGFDQEFSAIKRSGKHLVTMLHDILELTQFESGEVVIKQERFSVRPLLEKIAETAPREVEIVVANGWEREVLVSHQPSLDALLTKLLDNACKFTPLEGRIWLELHPFAKEDAVRLLSVRDEGPGIARAHHGSIFEAFSQLDNSSTRERDGAGLGLALVRHIAHHLEFAIDLQSEEGEGATFLLEIPSSKFEPLSS